MSLLDINFDGFSSAKLRQQILGLHVVIKKIYNFPEKFERPKFILPVKISWVLFFWGFLDGNENFAEIRAGSLSHLVASPLYFMFAPTPRTFVLQFSPVLQSEPACRLRCLSIMCCIFSPSSTWKGYFLALYFAVKFRCDLAFSDKERASVFTKYLTKRGNIFTANTCNLPTDQN